MEGYGVYIYIYIYTLGVRGDSYIGEWRASKAEGYGVHAWANGIGLYYILGDRYEGEWKACLKHGNGTDLFQNGDVYIGQYRYGKPFGYGQYIWKTGSSYVGEFKNGLKNGMGKWKKAKDGNSNQYEGEYVNDKKEGYGVFKWASGNVYRGQYRNDEREGIGEMRWTDGSVYVGMWIRGIQHGYGKMIFPDGAMKEGYFDNNVYKGEMSHEDIPYVLQDINFSVTQLAPSNSNLSAQPLEPNFRNTNPTANNNTINNAQHTHPTHPIQHKSITDRGPLSRKKPPVGPGPGAGGMNTLNPLNKQTARNPHTVRGKSQPRGVRGSSKEESKTVGNKHNNNNNTIKHLNTMPARREWGSRVIIRRMNASVNSSSGGNNSNSNNQVVRSRSSQRSSSRSAVNQNQTIGHAASLTRIKRYPQGRVVDVYMEEPREDLKPRRSKSNDRKSNIWVPSGRVHYGVEAKPNMVY